jgi:hypothetical protein
VPSAPIFDFYAFKGDTPKPATACCGTCKQTYAEGHAPTCDAVLVECGVNSCHAPLIRVNERPAAGTGYMRCSKCSTWQLVPSSLCARAA